MNRIYLEGKKLNVIKFPKRSVYLDAGTPENLLQSGSYVEAIQKTQGIKIACIEEIAFNNQWTQKKHLKQSIKFYGNCEYSNYLKKIIKS